MIHYDRRRNKFFKPEGVMNSRERFLAAINGRTPDRVPIVANLTE